MNITSSLQRAGFLIYQDQGKGNISGNVAIDSNRDKQIQEAEIVTDLNSDSTISASEVLEHVVNNVNSPGLLRDITINIQNTEDIFENFEQNKRLAIRTMESIGSISPNMGEHVLRIFRSLNSELQNDKDVVMTAFSYSWMVIEYLSDSLKDDRDVILAGLTKDHSIVYFYASERLRTTDKEIVLVTLENYTRKHYNTVAERVFKDLSSELRDDKEVVMLALSRDWTALKYVSERLRDDKEVICFAISKNGDAFEYASDRLKNDREVLMAAVSENGLSLEFTSDRLQDNKEIVLTAISENAKAFEFASRRLRNDRDFVLEAIAINGNIFEFASDRFKNDREFIVEAINIDGSAMQYASEQLREDRDLVVIAYKNCPEDHCENFFDYFSQEMFSYLLNYFLEEATGN